MKKWRSSVVKLYCILGILPASGEIITQDSLENGTSVTVGYNAGVSYTVTIPANVTFSDDEKKVESSLLASDVVLAEGSSLNIKLASLNDFKMINNGGYIEYSLLVNNHNAPEDGDFTVLSVPAGQNTGWALLDFVTELDREHAYYAGNYTDTLTFTVAVE